MNNYYKVRLSSRKKLLILNDTCDAVLTNQIKQFFLVIFNFSTT